MDSSSESLPIAWQWVALILAFVGTALGLVALPTIFQMIGGRPKVFIGYGGNAEGLEYSFEQPFVAGWLGRLGVRRSSVEISAHLYVRGVSTEFEISDPIAEMYHLDGRHGKFMTLTASLLPTLGLVVARFTDGSCMFRDFKTVIPPGTYEAELIVLGEGRDFVKSKRLFLVTTEAINWIEP